MTEIVDASDPRATWPAMTEAKREEIRGLWKRGSHKSAHCWEGCVLLRRGREEKLRCFIENENRSRKIYATDWIRGSLWNTETPGPKGP